MQQDEAIGRLNASNIDGDIDNDGDIDQIHVYGARSFTIWDSTGNQVFDSGDQIAQITAELFPTVFNSEENDRGEFDARSDNKGAEPEGVAVGQIDGRTYAFVGLERVGGVLVYDVSDPFSPLFQQYLRTDTDLSPEGLEFISASDSPNGEPMLAVTSEVSGTLRLYSLVSTQATAILDGSTLQIHGSSGDDVIHVDRSFSGPWIKVTWNGEEIGSFHQRDVDLIVADGKSGNDHITVGLRVKADTLLKGGLGDDILVGTQLGNNVLVGGLGQDLLFGGLKRDVLIGGRGEDVLHGGLLGLGDDLLIGGETAYDLDNESLQEISSYWSSGGYKSRVSALREGRGVPGLNAATVFDDEARDSLFGGLGNDWFFDGLDDDLDDRFFERVNRSGPKL